MNLKNDVGQKTSAHLPIQDEYSDISDKCISKSTCWTGRVEFAGKNFLFSSEV